MSIRTPSGDGLEERSWVRGYFICCHKALVHLFSFSQLVICANFLDAILDRTKIHNLLMANTPTHVIFLFQSGCDNSIFLAVPDWYSNNFCRVLELVQTYETIL
jgi:hypothetical protein